MPPHGWNSMRPEKELERLHNRLKTLTIGTGREIIDETIDKENDLWMLKVKNGNFVIFLIHPQKTKFIITKFVFRLDDKHKKLLKEQFSDPVKSNEYAYGLTAAITSLYTATTFQIEDCDNGQKIAVGFDIDAKMFPDDRSFSLGLLDNSIQSIVNMGILGMSFIGSLLRVGEMVIKQQEALSSSPDGMFL
jgi:hypothetical protein